MNTTLVLDYGDRRSYAACPVVPEFQFSPKAQRKSLERPSVQHPKPVYGPMPPPMVANPRKLHEPEVIGPIEQGWRNLQPQFTPKRREMRNPIGTTQTLEGMPRFISRAAEIQALAENQNADIPFIRDLLASNGIAVMSSSQDDDDMGEWEALSARHLAHEDVVWHDAVETGILQNQIQWERFNLACSLPTKTHVAHDGQQFTGVEHVSGPKLDTDTLIAQGGRLKESGWRDGRTPDEVEHDRHLARWRGTIGSGKFYDQFLPDEGLDKPYAAEDYEKPEVAKAGAVELGFHGEGDEDAYINPYEPGELYLWPLSAQELLWTLWNGQQLNDMELRWADAQGLKLPAPRVHQRGPWTETENEQGEGKEVSVEKLAEAG